MGCKLQVTTTSPFTDMLKTIHPQSRVAVVITMTSAEAMSYKQHDIKEQKKKKSNCNKSVLMVRGKWEAEELKDGEGAIGMTVQSAVHREGLLGWRRSHRLVGGDYCPVSALYDHTHTHARTQLMHTHLKRGGGGKAGLVGQVPVGSGVLPSPALSVQPPGSMWVCVWCPHIKSEMGLVPPTLHSRLCFSSGGAAACRPPSGLTCARRKPARRTGHRHRCYVLDWRTLALLWAERERKRSDMLRNRMESGVHNFQCAPDKFHLAYSAAPRLCCSATVVYNNGETLGTAWDLLQIEWGGAVEWCVTSERSIAERSLGGTTDAHKAAEEIKEMRRIICTFATLLLEPSI